MFCYACACALHVRYFVVLMSIYILHVCHVSYVPLLSEYQSSSTSSSSSSSGSSILQNVNSVNRHTPLLAINGQSDRSVPIAYAQRSYDILRKANGTVTVLYST